MKILQNEIEGMETLAACTSMLYKLGYRTQFQALESGLKSLTTGRIYLPNEVRVVNFYRFEGDSAPEDNSILYAIQTITGERGTLTDAYGHYSDTDVTNFMKQVDEIEKKTNKEKSL
jgi:hypothetical protein